MFLLNEKRQKVNRNRSHAEWDANKDPSLSFSYGLSCPPFTFSIPLPLPSLFLLSGPAGFYLARLRAEGSFMTSLGESHLNKVFLLTFCSMRSSFPILLYIALTTWIPFVSHFLSAAKPISQFLLLSLCKDKEINHETVLSVPLSLNSRITRLGWHQPHETRQGRC